MVRTFLLCLFPPLSQRAAPVEMAETSSRRAALLGLAAVAVPAAANAATPFWQVNKKGISRPQKSTEGCDALKACAKGAGLKWAAAALGVKAADTRKCAKRAPIRGSALALAATLSR